MQPEPFVCAGLARSLGIPEAEWVTGLRASVVCVECLGASRDPLFVHEAPHPARVRRIHDGQRPRHEITSKCTAPGFLDTEQDVIVIDSALASFSHRGETA